jgi:Ca-activated chloride channel family protein
VSVQAPIEPGDYEARYVLGAPQRVLARVPLEAVAVEATLEASATVGAGTPFAVSWSGPNAANDWITIIGADAAAQDYGSYVDANQPSPANLDAPVAPGAYELRYVAAGRKILARRAIEVSAVSASIEGPASVAAGAPFEIRWQGPDSSGDWLTIIGPDAAASAYGSYVDANQGSPSTLNAPIAPGNYELRYVQKGTTVLARRPIEVSAVSATLEAPDSVTAGAPFEIRWQGPNNRGDWITIIGTDAGASAYGSYVDADQGSPSTLTAPAAAGDYELRYVQKGTSVLARRPIRVTAP